MATPPTSLLVLALAGLAVPAHAADRLAFQAWSTRPPMGWNSWDCFATTVTEAQARAHADIMGGTLARHGWNILTIDIQWYEPNATGFDYRKDATLEMDAWGRLIPAAVKFPSAANGVGFKALADYIHGRGLKFGVHLMRGIPRQAVAARTPVKGTPYTAADVADTSSTCFWNGDMYGVDMRKPGAQAYYDSVFELLASWGLDFVKVDDLSGPYHTPEIEAIRLAIDRSGRPIILSTSPGPTPLAQGPHVQEHANMWRISGDFWDQWSQLYAQFDRLRDWTPFRGPGHFPDADMLPLGLISMGKRRTNFTADEQVTLLSLWSIARSPLILGADLTHLDDATLALVTNDEVIAVDQDSTDNRELFERDGFRAWTARAPGSAGTYLALFNTRPLPGQVDPSLAAYGSAPVTRRTPGQGVPVDVDIEGATTLYLVADDNRGGSGGDNVVWSEPVLEGARGPVKLTDFQWTRATSGEHTGASTRTSATGGTMRVAGRTPAFGIAAHALSVIEYAVPPGMRRFRAFAGIDDGGAPAPRGPWPGPTVRFLVFTRSPFAVEPSAPVPVALAELGIAGTAAVRDVWRHLDLGPVTGTFAPTVRPHGAGLYLLSPKP